MRYCSEHLRSLVTRTKRLSSESVLRKVTIWNKFVRVGNVSLHLWTILSCNLGFNQVLQIFVLLTLAQKFIKNLTRWKLTGPINLEATPFQELCMQTVDPVEAANMVDPHDNRIAKPVLQSFVEVLVVFDAVIG